MKTVSQLLDIKGRKIFSVAPETLVYDALLTMAEHHIGALLVMRRDELGHFVAQSGPKRVGQLFSVEQAGRHVPCPSLVNLNLDHVSLTQHRDV